MGNFCSGCHRDLYDQRHTASESARVQSRSARPISDCIEEHRHYTEKLMDANQMNAKNSFQETLSQQSEKPQRVGKMITMNDFWERHAKIKKKGFNLAKRPAAVYTIDTQLFSKLINGSTFNQESHYYQIDANRLMEAVRLIQRWFREKSAQKKKKMYLFKSNAAVKAHSGDVNSVMDDTIDVSIWQS